MTTKKLKLGVIYTWILILIQLLFASTFTFDFMTESYDDKKELIYKITYLYAYVSILTLIRKIVVDNYLISKYLTWIIRLEILRVLSSLLVTINIFQAKALVSLIGLFLFVFYVLFFVNVLRKKYNNKVEITELRPFTIAFTISAIIAAIGGIYAEYNREFEFYGILFLILAIPYFFIIGYFNKMKTEVAKFQTTDPE